MKILVICQYYYPEPFRIHEITQELVRRDYKVTVLTTYPNYPEGKIYDGYVNKETKREVINGVDVIRISSRPRKTGSINLGLSFIDFYIKASRFIKRFEEEFDVVYSYQLSPVIQIIPAYKYAKKHNVPLYVYCLDIWPESILDVFPSDKSLFYKLVKKWSVSIYKKANLIGVTSQSFIDYFRDDLGIKDITVHYLPQHSDDVKGNDDFTTEDNDCFDLFFMGNVGESQNMDMVIDAVSLIKDISGYKIHIVGEGSMYNHSVERVQKEGLTEKIVFYGRKPYSEMPDFYKKADACLLTLANVSKIGLTIPGKLQNYMAAGKPVIASIGGDAPRVINESKCGIYAKPDDPKALAAAILEFVNNRGNYVECGANAREYYLENFTLEKHVDRLVEELIELVR